LTHPVKIKILEKKKLSILWDDGKHDLLELKMLRKFCPCATCLAERDKQDKMYIPILNENQIIVRSINQVGKYAIQINWNDGHNTGIYEYPFLRNLSSS
jgi:ATP-binding protein involved in chromosome partitioning